ncbi:hypothetical protein [Flavobacterium frigidarium]|uniref:hypothetical protein n=1 Tax=Flavobacterium frigidarium TaxID=99286 RepID=UPI00047BDB7D|nr:hypothetical protein [Flavobacterium frigidarium]
MKEKLLLHKMQLKRAKEVLQVLEVQKNQISIELEKNPSCSALNKDLRLIVLDIKITCNEIEQAKSDIDLTQAEILKIV